VVDPAPHVAERDLHFQAQGLRLDRLRTGSNRAGQDHRSSNRNPKKMTIRRVHV
jgi:hypothetical protein